ncbi:YbaN family protein [Methylophaga thalassica]|uniref:YbaN family protein n=1 Tax=Methylophaga thalassica TaxID=40223 RepID=UPI002E7BEAB7|nr:YbaN family protein [Methylophaga thalassica]WVI85424.1 YbaN family protein [Methylophaga thalassica]
MVITLLWRFFALIFLGIAFAGVILPGLPTTEFLLMALWCSAKGWPQLHHWLLHHPRFGHMIQQWQQHRAIPRRAKVIALVSMTISCCLLFLSGLPLWVKCLSSSMMVAVLYWLITRPQPSNETEVSQMKLKQ